MMSFSEQRTKNKEQRPPTRHTALDAVSPRKEIAAFAAMTKTVFALCSLFFVLISVLAQRPARTTIVLDHSESLSFDKERFPDRQVLRGDVKFHHDNAVMYCDSAYFYDRKNSFDAFGNVEIIQGDTLFTYGDVLYYDGNTRLARLRGNVEMDNGSANLTTDSLNYDRNTQTGYFFNGGTLADSLNTLTSDEGYYYLNTKTAVFKRRVKLKNPNFDLFSDTLRYNTDTGIAYIVGPSNIYHKDTHIYSENGWYDTRQEQAMFLDRSYIHQKDGRNLLGDTLFYNKREGTATARRNVEMLDSLRQITLSGDYGFYNELTDYGFVTGNALMRDHSSADTLYLHADTLAAVGDTVCKRVMANYHTRFFRHDLQSKCDSLVYTSCDSTLTLYRSPVVWSGDNQLSADEIRVHTANGKVERLHALGSAMAIGVDDSIRFNQVSGKEIIGYLRDSTLYKTEVIGNVRTIYFPREDDGTLISTNKAESSFMTLYFENKKVEKVTLTPDSQGVLYPPEQLTGDALRLDSFQWWSDIRPLRKEDIFLRFDTPAPVKKKTRRN